MIAAIVIALFQGTAAPADQPPAAPPTEQTAPAVDPLDVMHCERVRPVGSRIATERICMTERERQRLRDENLHNMREATSRSGANTQPNPR